jgi:tetratricopeptide (TPR) repeat protein
MSDLVYFAKAYKELREGDYDQAEQLFNDASRLYSLRGPTYGYMLPYMAFAASKSGNTQRTLAIMNRVGAPENDFEYLLARAVMAALSGQTEQSVRLLRQARHHRPYTETRPIFTEYQYAEISEWLYVETGAIEYRAIALEWARLCQRNQPWHAWPYAMEAKLSDDSTARGKAIAMAHYLDPLSERLNTLPQSTIDSAVSQFERLIPFRQDLKGTSGEQRVDASPVHSQEEPAGDQLG